MFCSGRFPTPPPPKTIYAPLSITALLADEMTKRGHKVTLFGARGSRSKAKVANLGLPPLDNYSALKKCIDIRENRAINFYEQIYISEVYRRANQGEFDVIHIHPAENAIGFAANSSVPTIFTLHDPITCWRKFAYSAYKKHKSAYFVSISHSQRQPLKNLNYIANIYNGIDTDKYSFKKSPGDYLLIASRIVAVKGFDVAVKVAEKTGLPLKIAGEILDQPYWDKEVKPYLNDKITYVGMVTPSRLPALYKNALAFLFPIKWEEPFGLVMTEAMSCGTPVVAFNRGSVKEVIKNGKTGFVVNNLDEMVQAVGKISTIDRKTCRERVEENFSLKAMVDKYEEVYKEAVRRGKK